MTQRKEEAISLPRHLVRSDSSIALPEREQGGAQHPPITLAVGFINQELAPG